MRPNCGLSHQSLNISFSLLIGGVANILLALGFVQLSKMNLVNTPGLLVMGRGLSLFGISVGVLFAMVNIYLWKTMLEKTFVKRAGLTKFTSYCLIGGLVILKMFLLVGLLYFFSCFPASVVLSFVFGFTNELLMVALLVPVLKRR